VCQTNGVDGGAASTQAQAALNWLAKLGGQYIQSGSCGTPGAPNYSFCPIAAHDGTPAGSIDVFMECAHSNSRSPDGVTCPGRYFVTTESPKPVVARETDVPGPLGFERFYNSDSPEISTLVTGWSHSFSRRIAANMQAAPFQHYSGVDAHTSSLYPDAATACTSGWRQISAGSHATSSYANGVCVLDQGGSIQVWNASAAPTSLTGTPVSFDAIRDDGQRAVDMHASRTADGYQLADVEGTTEAYDASGKLLSITSRDGMALTMAYNPGGQLVTVEDSAGHLLTLGYDSQGRLANVTDHNSHFVEYSYDAFSRLQRAGSRRYAYEISAKPYLVTRATDER
jgi:YD repeat-containing protein